MVITVVSNISCCICRMQGMHELKYKASELFAGKNEM